MLLPRFLTRLAEASRALLIGVPMMLLHPVLSSASESPMSVPAPNVDAPKTAGPFQTAVLSGGCFWGVQGVFEHMVGVHQALSGYAGGAANTASYEVVSGGDTGHAESVKITYDPSKISFGQILQVYFSVATDPTQLNRQGPDRGTQYRSAIFYSNDEQKKIAESYIAQLGGAKIFSAPIVTQVTPLKGFYPAEGYHQDYLIENPYAPYILFNDAPKIKAFQKLLPALYQEAPVRVTAYKG